MLSTVTVDVGTTSVKLCHFGAGGRALVEARHATPVVADRFGQVYDLEALLALVTGFVAGLDARARAGVQRIALTGVGESGALVRPDLSPASPTILWHDQRGAPVLAGLADADRALVRAVTGLPVNANYGLSKAAWAWARAVDAEGAQWLNVVEQLAALMTGERWSEHTLASRTMALDLRTGAWSAEVCALVGLPVEVFPLLRSAGEGAALTTATARALGLGEDVVVHVAGHDHVVGAVGADLGPGELLNSTGTTEGLLVLQDAPRLDEAATVAKLAAGLACTGRPYTLFASIPTGGSAFATLGGLLGLTAEQLVACTTDLHERYVAGAVDLDAVPLVLPRFRGSPPPDKRAADRGMLAGIGPATAAEDVVLGCFLGMALQFLDVLELFGARPPVTKVIGPATRNPLWMQLKADLLGAPLSASGSHEVVSRGAQALASGERPPWSGCAPREVDPHPRGRERLAEWQHAVRPQWEHLKALPARGAATAPGPGR